MSMLSKVKKLGTKLFSTGKLDKDSTSDDGSDAPQLESPSKTRPGRVGKVVLHDSSSAGASQPASPSLASPHMVQQSGKSVTGAPNGTFLSPAKRAALTAMQVHTSTDSLGVKSPTRNDVVLPAVQISPHHIHHIPHPVATANLAPEGSPAAGSPMGSSRRKSTPAALDMALRTAEGKAAIQQLLTNQQIKKPMAYAQYFGSSISSTATPMLSPNEPRAPLAQRIATKTVPEEDEVVDDGHDVSASHASEQSHSSPSNFLSAASKRPGADARLPSPKPVTASAAPAASAPADDEPAPTSVPIPSPKAIPIPKAKLNVEAPALGLRPNKLLSLSPHLPAIMARKYWSLADYSIVRKMYTGYASTVYQATCKKSLEQVALKVYHMENLCELNHYQVYREIRVHSTLQHQNIIHLLAAFQEGTDVVLVQEYAEGGDLYRLLHRNGGRLSERQAVEMVLHPFLLALHYLHTRGIMHRDVKPENVLFTDQRVLKLADFGLAIDLNEERAVTRAGTLDYMAPEVLRCPPKNLPQENKNNAYLHYNNSVDAWAVGVFAYELVVGFPPFAGESQLDSVDKIMHSTPEFPEKMTELAKAFICQALKKHPGDRPTVIEMLHHPWIRSYQRRTSMLHMPAPRARRGSSLAYVEPAKLSPLPSTPTEPSSPASVAAVAAASAAAPAPSPLAQGQKSPGQQGAGASATPPARSSPPGSLSQVSSQVSSSQVPLFDGNPEDMTPEQIEGMIRKLMLAKQVAIDRSSAGQGRGSSGGPVSNS